MVSDCALSHQIMRGRTECKECPAHQQVRKEKGWTYDAISGDSSTVADTLEFGGWYQPGWLGTVGCRGSFNGKMNVWYWRHKLKLKLEMRVVFRRITATDWRDFLGLSLHREYAERAHSKRTLTFNFWIKGLKYEGWEESQIRIIDWYNRNECIWINCSLSWF